MKVLKRSAAILLCISLCMVLAHSQSARGSQQEIQAVNTSAQDVLIIIEREQVRFTAQSTVAQMQLQVFDQAGEISLPSFAEYWAEELTRQHWLEDSQPLGV